MVIKEDNGGISISEYVLRYYIKKIFQIEFRILKHTVHITDFNYRFFEVSFSHLG